MHLIDSDRVFEEIIGFPSHGYVISLQYLLRLLDPGRCRHCSISRVSGLSMLTLIGIVFLLIPLHLRTWRAYRPRH